MLLLPGFATYWRHIQTETHIEPIFHTLDIIGTDGELLHVHPLRIRPCNYDYPQIWAYQPEDAITREVLKGTEEHH